MIHSNRSTNSGSNWLDRLRSNKGFPIDDDNLDLDSFLLQLTPTHSPKPKPTKQARNPTLAHDPPLTSLLAQLFNPGAYFTPISKKCPRKQTNPKIFVPSSTTTGNSPSTFIASAACDKAAADAEVEGEDHGEEENKCEDDLKGFTRSEVTVIDTSCSVWKVDKFVFRKNSVWKIRERKFKLKTKHLAKKTKKSSHEIDIHGIGSSKDNVVNTGGEKPGKKRKVI